MAFGLIGSNVGRSYSKRIHEQFGYGYNLWSLSETEFAPFMQAKDFDGINVTIPYKRAAMLYCAELSDAAKRIGGVNTIVKRADGSLYGDNTDYAGLLGLIARLKLSLAGKKAVILGTGGTSLTALCVARDAGAREVVRVSREGGHNYANIEKHYDADALINTTPVGMYPDNARTPLSLSGFARLQGVIDVIYDPLRTRLCQDAAEFGIPAAGGLYMLVIQAAGAARLFTGEDIPETRTREVYQSLARGRRNIVLIGMPGCGKTAVGHTLAESLARPLADMDALIEAGSGRSIPAIFAADGEAAFRAIESAVAAEAGGGTAQIISTGGGVVLFPENMKNLAQNGRIYFIDRPPELLERAGRPLSGDADAVARLYRERLPLYRKYADKIVANNALPEDAARAILEDFYETVGD
jgi:shikimate dehydrogenase